MGDLPRVDYETVVKAQMLAARVYDSRASQTPEGRSQAGVRAGFEAVGPKAHRNLRARHRAHMEGEERKEPLGARRQHDYLTPAGQHKPADKCEQKRFRFGERLGCFHVAPPATKWAGSFNPHPMCVA